MASGVFRQSGPGWLGEFVQNAEQEAINGDKAGNLHPYKLTETYGHIAP